MQLFTITPGSEPVPKICAEPKPSPWLSRRACLQGRGYDIGGLLSSHFHKTLAPAFDDVHQSVTCSRVAAVPFFKAELAAVDFGDGTAPVQSEGDLTTAYNRAAAPVQGEPVVLSFSLCGNAGGTDGAVEHLKTLCCLGLKPESVMIAVTPLLHDIIPHGWSRIMLLKRDATPDGGFSEHPKTVARRDADAGESWYSTRLG